GFLNLKSFLLNDLIRDIHDIIKDKIEKNYESYQKFLIHNLKDFCEEILEEDQEFRLILNKRDFNYFNKNSDNLCNNLSNSFQIEKGEEEFTGGFKVYIEKEKLSYDSTINNLLEQYSNYIEGEFSKIVSDKGIKQIQQEFEQFTKRKKSEMKEYLKEYERI
ncbi:MAG: hypothetical protein ACOC4M_15900, partial [Promethearchaeia archaeon]